MNKITILGIGDEGPTGLTQFCREKLNAAEIVIAAPSTLAQLDSINAQTIPLRNDLDEIVALIKSLRDKRIVMLSLGDPLFFGTTRYLCDEIGKDEFDIIPHVSMMQLAFRPDSRELGRSTFVGFIFKNTGTAF